ncbi:SDR family oxidoreductase [Olivibacter domesticus]|uniref:Short-chain dehydrogenase n=1 Tax=Olivibacter domesticus TaxID=407022 RepID=A0A1H7JE72_OLID1|nr:SDR family oxidoreductase [Olivibacter domesticus]SEK72893.1 Short-chain dehydrogenase [Olivibacter domesticus]
MKAMNNQIWYITGASKGLGLALTKKLLKEGHKVAATSRNKQELATAVGADESIFLPLAVHLTDENSVQQSISETIAHFGRIDVVVNNAGYGLVGALEELTDVEARENFDINVFGSLNVIRQSLPYMRKQQSGHIFNIASIGGFAGGFPGFGIYCATKFAVHGFTESLAHEIKDFGLSATVVMPGYFRTNFLSDTSLNVPKNEISDYKTVRAAQNAHTNDYNGNQAGDPDKAAEVLIEVAQMEQPPIHLFLGQDAYDLAETKMSIVKTDMHAVKDLATATALSTKLNF